MAFPGIPTVANGRVLTAVAANTTATRTFPNLSSLTKNSGDLLIAIVIAYQSSTTNAQFSSWGGGFTEFHDSGSSTTMAMGMAYKWSTGSETGTFTVTQSATITGHAVMILLSIPGAHATTAPVAGTRVSGTTAAADPGGLSTSWSTEDCLWLDVIGSGETSTTGSYTGVSGSATNYGSDVLTGITGDVIGGVEGGVGFRQLATSLEDVGPANVDISNARNGAVVIVVRPAPEGTLDQTHYRFRNDNGSESAATWKAASNTAVTIPRGEQFRLRFGIENATANSISTDYQLMYRKNGGAWAPITASSANVRAIDSTHITVGGATTQQITTGTFAAGLTDDDDAFFNSITVPGGARTEIEVSLTTVTGDLIDGDVLEIKPAKGNWADINGYSGGLAQMTLGVPSTPDKEGSDSATQTDIATISKQQPLVALSSIVPEDFEGFTTGSAWPAGSTQGKWLVEWVGPPGSYVGAVSDGADKALQLYSPETSGTPEWGATGSSLVVSKDRISGDFDVTLDMRTIAQSRAVDPADWEVGWFGWHFQRLGTNPNVVRFYYIILKPGTGGFELGKVDQSTSFPGGQRFLPTLNVGTTWPVGTTWKSVRVKQTGSLIEVWVDGVKQANFTDGPGSGGTPAWGDTAGEVVFTEGQFVFYQEDSTAEFDNLVATVSTTPITGTDSATQSDSSAAIAALTPSDSATQSDTSSLTATASSTDSATQSDTSSLTSAAAGVDSATQGDSGLVGVTPQVSDSATQSDASSLTATRDSSDSATQSDASTPTAVVASTDSVSFTDVASVDKTAPKSGTDAGSVADASAVTTAQAVVDSATQSDSGQVEQPLSLVDSATQSDVSQTSQSVDLVDSATQSDAASVNKALEGADSFALGEVSTVSAGGSPSAFDTATQSDSAALTASSQGSDSSALSDVSAPSASLSVSDAASHDEASGIGLATGDALSALDASSLTADRASSDAHSQSDISDVGRESSSGDSATQSDSGSVGGAITSTDGGTFTEVSYVSKTIAVVDSATLSDVGNAQNLGNPDKTGADVQALSEAVDLTATQPATDSASLGDVGQVAASAAAGDLAGLTEQMEVGAQPAGGDSASLSEASELIRLVGATGGDAASLTETSSIEVQLVVEDQGIVGELASVTALAFSSDQAGQTETVSLATDIIGWDEFALLELSLAALQTSTPDLGGVGGNLDLGGAGGSLDLGGTGSTSDLIGRRDN